MQLVYELSNRTYSHAERVATAFRFLDSDISNILVQLTVSFSFRDSCTINSVVQCPHPPVYNVFSPATKITLKMSRSYPILFSVPCFTRLPPFIFSLNSLVTTQFHLVRHPLAAIASLTECFCGCGSMSCGGWADVPSWKWAGKFVEFSERHCSRCEV